MVLQDPTAEGKLSHCVTPSSMPALTLEYAFLPSLISPPCIIQPYAFELWCWRRLESPLDCKEIQPAHPKGDQSWVFTRRTDVEAETPILWPPDGKS